MEKNQAIQVAQAFSEFTTSEKYFVTTDQEVFTSAEAAVEHSVKLSPGNPEIETVLASELVKVKAPAASTTKVEKLEAAKAKVASLQAVFDEKTTAKETAEGNKKGAATVALNKAIANLELAKQELVDAEALTGE